MVALSPRKTQELNQLRLVYAEEDFPVVKDRERPDFALLENEHWFGVEVTSYFQNTASAHFHRNAKHFAHLVDTGMVPKKERKDIAIANFVLDLPEGPTLSPNMVWRERPSAQVRLRELAALIDRKCLQAGRYDAVDDLEHIDLVIVDEQAELIAGSERNSIWAYLSGLREQHPPVTPFRRVSLVILGSRRENHLFTFD